MTNLNNDNSLLASPTWDNGHLVDAGRIFILIPRNEPEQTQSGLSDTLSSGIHVTLQANNDITLNQGANILVAGNNGGALTLQAGRNINLNASIRTANGDLTAIAGDPNAMSTDRDAGIPTITLGLGMTIDAGTGKVILAAIGGDFVNLSGSTKPITTSQWLIYSTDS